MSLKFRRWLPSGFSYFISELAFLSFFPSPPPSTLKIWNYLIFIANFFKIVTKVVSESHKLWHPHEERHCLSKYWIRSNFLYSFHGLISLLFLMCIWKLSGSTQFRSIADCSDFVFGSMHICAHICALQHIYRSQQLSCPELYFSMNSRSVGRWCMEIYNAR